jgi:hypothetical protein
VASPAGVEVLGGAGGKLVEAEDHQRLGYAWPGEAVPGRLRVDSDFLRCEPAPEWCRLELGC